VAATMTANGFKSVTYERLFGGIVAIHVGVRE
jgi:ubiquinone/menaquinone biosynthesis C-methylase UbiE